MKRLKFLSVLITLVVTVIAFVACGDDETNAPQTKKDAVVAIFKNGNIDYWKQIATTVTTECKRLGVEPIISFIDDDSDAGGQLAAVSLIKNLSEGYNIKGIIAAPVFTATDHRVESKLAEVAGRSIPIIIIDSPVDEASSPLNGIYKAYVGTDNKAAGRLLAQKCGIKDPSAIFTARVAISTPTVDRYSGFCEVMGQELPLWETVDLDTPENFTAELAKHPNAKDIVFFNGNLCNSVKSAFKDVNVYTFDVYEQFLTDLKNPESSIKGVMAQNTFEMGRQAVNAIFGSVSEKNIYIPTIYITSENLDADEVKPFFDYYKYDRRK